MTSCGETDERIAAFLHGTVLVLYIIMGLWHGASVVKHWSRR